MDADSALDRTQQIPQMPDRYDVEVFLRGAYATAKKDGARFRPNIRFDQLANFLINDARDGVVNLHFNGSEGLENVVTRVLDRVMPNRLDVDTLSFDDFQSQTWPAIERILDTPILCADAIRFTRLQVPSGVDAPTLVYRRHAYALLELKVVRDCHSLSFLLFDKHLRHLPGTTPLFDDAPLLQWIKQPGRELDITSDYLYFGLGSFVNTLKEDFRQATEAQPYRVNIHCPSINDIAKAGVRDEVMEKNECGEVMVIYVCKIPNATDMMGDEFDSVKVVRKMDV